MSTTVTFEIRTYDGRVIGSANRVVNHCISNGINWVRYNGKRYILHSSGTLGVCILIDSPINRPVNWAHTLYFTGRERAYYRKGVFQCYR